MKLVKQKGLAPILIVILIAAVAGLAGFLIYSQQPKPTPLPQKLVISQTPQPSPIQSSIPVLVSESTNSAETISTEQDQNANWKTYKATDFAFMYPPGYSVDYDSYNKTYYILQKRLSSYNNSTFEYTSARINFEPDFNEAKRLAQNEVISDLEIKQINGGIQITGKGPGYTKATTVYIVLFHYKEGAIKFELGTTLYENHNSNLLLFNEILSPFKFLP